MWTASPTSWTSRHYLVEDERGPLGTFGYGGWSTHGTIEHDRRRFDVQREGFWNPRYHLVEGSKRLATASSPGTFKRGFTIAYGDEEFALASVAVFSRSFELTQRGRPLGSIHSLGAFSRRASVELDGSLAPELRMFVAWLVVLAWRRAAAAAAAT